MCVRHGGGAPQVRRAAQRRVLLAELLARQDPRPLGEVLADAVRTGDALHTYTVGRVAAAGEPVDPDLLGQLADAARSAAALARLGMELRIESPADRTRAVGAEVAAVLGELSGRLGADGVAGWSELVGDTLRALGDGRARAHVANQPTLIEAEVARRVEAEVVRRLALKAIPASPASTVSGPETSLSGGGGDDPRQGPILAERGVGDSGSVPPGVAEAEAAFAGVFDARPADAEGSGGVRVVDGVAWETPPCPRCGRPLGTPMHRPDCPGEGRPVFGPALEWAR